MRLDELGFEQKDLAAATEVTESYISQLLTGEKSPQSLDEQNFYEKMGKSLKLPNVMKFSGAFSTLWFEISPSFASQVATVPIGKYRLHEEQRKGCRVHGQQIYLGQGTSTGNYKLAGNYCTRHKCSAPTSRNGSHGSLTKRTAVLAQRARSGPTSNRTNTRNRILVAPEIREGSHSPRVRPSCWEKKLSRPRL